MQAIWSFWSKPFHAKQGSTWLSDRHHLYSTTLSLVCAMQHFNETILYTDDHGAELLIDKLQLPYKKVSTSLNDINEYDESWWTVGKLHAYSKQNKPFLHIDNDVYLWKALPNHFKDATIIGQNPEYFQSGSSWYQPEKFDSIIEARYWVPKELVWYREQKHRQMAVCCGIFGGYDTEFIRRYAKQALKLIDYSQSDKTYHPIYGDNLLIEQYFLSALVNFHQQSSCHNGKECKSAYIFDSAETAFNPKFSTKAGFTHLIGGAKRNPKLLDRLEARILNDFPEYYERINSITT